MYHNISVHKDYVLNEPNIFEYQDVNTSKILLISDAQSESVSQNSERLRELYNNSNLLIKFNGPIDSFDIDKYPYTSMDANFDGLYGIEVRIAKIN